MRWTINVSNDLFSYFSLSDSSLGAALYIKLPMSENNGHCINSIDMITQHLGACAPRTFAHQH